MKKILFIVLIGIAFSCEEQQAAPELKESVEVTEEQFQKFSVAYQGFVSSLSESQRQRLSGLVESDSRPSPGGRTQGDAICKCLVGYASCSASGKFSSCCICWDPKTHNGACGTYFGLASCMIEKIDLGSKTPKPLPPGTKTLYPKEIGSVLDELTIDSTIDASALKAMLADM